MAKINHKLKNLASQVFGNWKVLSRTEKEPYDRIYWLCVCICGKQINVLAQNLVNGRSQSCGCQKTYKRRLHMKIQGLSVTQKREYIIWYNMMQRCYNSMHKSYHQYGGRGIFVCLQWHEFFNFFSDMGERPGQEFSIERIDNNGHYTKKNCKWATRKEQARNTRTNHFLIFNEQIKTIAEWSEITNLSANCILYRLNSGWPIEKVLSKKPRYFKK